MMEFSTLYSYDWQHLHDRYVDLMNKMQVHFNMDEYDVCAICLTDYYIIVSSYSNMSSEADIIIIITTTTCRWATGSPRLAQMSLPFDPQHFAWFH